jgi:hypothetical protein
LLGSYWLAGREIAPVSAADSSGPVRETVEMSSGAAAGLFGAFTVRRRVGDVAGVAGVEGLSGDVFFFAIVQILLGEHCNKRSRAPHDDSVQARG